MRNFVSEYRRRAREKTEKDERETKEKEREAKDESRAREIGAAIQRVEQELNRTNDESHPQNRSKRRWDRAGTIGLWAAAAVGTAAVWIGSHDAGEQRGVMENQLVQMRGQLEMMKTDTTIRQNEIAANMELTLNIETGGKGWQITPKWTNVGKTAATDVRGWVDMHTFHPGDKAEEFDFLTNNTGGTIESGTIIATGHYFHRTMEVTVQDAWEYVYGVGVTASYGSLEHQDIFKNDYSIRYCRFFNFIWDGRKMTVTFPVKLSSSCELRTEKEHKQEER